MNTQEIFAFLKSEFGLKTKHIQVIESLQSLPLTAEQLSKRTEIPLGRIYEYLNQLVDMKLIEKTVKKPYFYEIKDLNKAIVDFLKHKTDKMIVAKTQVLDMMKDKGTGSIEVIDSKEAYSHHHLHIITEGKSIKILTHTNSFPLALYPEKWDDFIALRNLVRENRNTLSFSDYNSSYLAYKTYKDAIEKGKSIEIITQKDTWDNTLELMKEKFGALYVQHYLKEIDQRLKDNELQVHLTEEFTPMEVDVNEYRVGVALRHEHITTGIVLQNSNAVDVYAKLFEQIQSRATPLHSVIDELRNQKLTDLKTQRL